MKRLQRYVIGTNIHGDLHVETSGDGPWPKWCKAEDVRTGVNYGKVAGEGDSDWFTDRYFEEWIEAQK